MAGFETTTVVNPDGTETQTLVQEEVEYRLRWIMRGTSGYVMKTGGFATVEEALDAKADPFYNAPADARVIRSTKTETIKIEEEFVTV